MSLGRKEKRELGLLPRHVLGYLKDLKAEGIELEATSTSELAQLALACAMDGPCSAGWATTTAVDWDAIKEFLEWLIPLLIELISLFG